MFSKDESKPDAAKGALPPTQDVPESYATRAGLAHGTRLADRYRIVRLLGKGGMGSVYEAVDETRSGLRVALKLLDVHVPQALYRLKNEFRALAETVHPNLVGLHRLAADANGWFVVMDLIDPSNNFQRYVRGVDGGAFDEARLRSALLQLVRGVAAIHAADKVHRDLKPSNVLVTREGRVVIVDFGLVGEREQGGVGRTLEGWFAGTPAYAAPEQALGLAIGPQADLYALGVLLFEALTGRLPIADDSIQRLLERKQRESLPDPRSLAPDAPEDLCALCLGLLQRDPAERPDIQQVLAQLERGPVAPAALASLPFVGRERELAQLGEAASQLRRGAPVLALVSGASGIGKTALVARFLERMRAEPGVVMLRGRCHAQEQVPYNAFDMLIDALSRHLAKLLPVEAASLMPRDVALVARVFPTLGRVPAVLQMPSGASQLVDAPLLRARAFGALKELLARIADRGPLILCFDDLQWADEDSSELLRELLRGPDAPACLFVCASRPDESETGVLAALRATSPGRCIELRLEPLSAAAAAELARAMLEGGGSREAELRLVVGESAGSPFLIKELARGARLRGQVGNLGETVAAISAGLEADARGLLELVCVAARPLALDVAMRSARVGPQALPGALASSLLRTSMHSGRESIESSHDRIGDAVLETIGAARRAELHEQLAQDLSQDPQHDPDLIAQHYRAAGRSGLAAPYTVRAAERAREALAFSRAAELYEVALAEAGAEERGALELSLAETYTSIGRLSDAAERYASIAQRCEPSVRRRNLTSKAMQLYGLAGYPERAAPLADELCRELDLRPVPRAALLALLLQMWLFLRYLLGPRIRSLPTPGKDELDALGRERVEFLLSASRGFFHCSPEHSRHFGLQAMIFARRHRDARSWPLLLAGEVLSRGIQRGAPHEEEQRALQRATALAEAQGDPEIFALVLTVSGGYDLLTCQAESALRTFERAEQVLKICRQPVIHDLIGARNARMSTWTYFGHYTELLQHAEGWIAQAEAMGEVIGALGARIIASDRFLALHDLPAARAALVECRSELAQNTFLSCDPRWPGELALYEADPQAALAAWEDARRSRFFRSAMLMSAHRTLCAHLQARACVMAAEQGQPGDYARAALRHARKLERERYAFGPAAAAQTRGGIAMLCGDRALALSELTRAAALHVRAGTVLYAAAVRHRIGLLRGGEEGRAQVEEARSAALALGVRSPDHWFRSLVPGFSD